MNENNLSNLSGLLIAAGIIVAILLAGYLLSHGYKIRKLEVNLGGVVKGEIVPQIVKRVSMITKLHDLSGKPAKLPEIEIRVFDTDNKPMTQKRVKLDLFTATGEPCNSWEKETDESGIVTFSNLKIERTGQYKFTATCDNEFTTSAVFTVMPPGLETNFSDEKFGSNNYKERFFDAMLFNKGNDKVKIDGEDVS